MMPGKGNTKAVIGFIFILAIEVKVLIVAMVKTLDLRGVFRELIEVVLVKAFAGAEFFHQLVFQAEAVGFILWFHFLWGDFWLRLKRVHAADAEETRRTQRV